jgi:hypothetical protein
MRSARSTRPAILPSNQAARRLLINCGLRTLRRALNLADEWGKIDRAPKFGLAKGERQRERVVTQAEFLRLSGACAASPGTMWQPCSMARGCALARRTGFVGSTFY